MEKADYKITEFLQLYPGANILVATKKDFEPANRKKFCARIAMGNYDAIIIGHSQFERIPISDERQEAMLRKQIDDLEMAIQSARYEQDGGRYTVKQIEKTRKTLQTRLEKLNQKEKKDQVVTFEELGVDHLYVDEAHSYKNAFLYTKMRNVAGIAQNEAQKSADMFNKCQYLDEITGGKGITFATGTPISNSMTELYVMQRYLQNSKLQNMGLGLFDSWASTFGEVVTSIELAPEGTGYRAKSRFARFYNIPELMNMFKEIADIKTSDQLKLPVPEAEYETVVLKPTEQQKEIVESLGERAEVVRNGGVDASVDNMLKITNLVDFDATAEKRRIQEKLLNNDMNLCLLEIMRDSLIALRDYPKNGQLYYRLLKYRYFEAGNTNEDVMLMLDDMPSTTYYRNRKKAIRLYATMLWAFTRPEKIQNKMEEINWKKSGSKVAVN